MPTRSQRHKLEIQGGGSGVVDPAPVISTPGAQTVAENTAFSVVLAANESVTWSKAGGADALLFSIAGNVLSMPPKDFENPTDADLNNAYVVNVRATDVGGNQTNKTITVTVTNITDSFFDDFNAADAGLETRSGWTRITGVANGAGVRSNMLAGLDTGAPGSLYYSPDLGNADHWVEIKLPPTLPTNSGPFAVCRAAADAQNYVGIRTINASIECYRRDASNMNALSSPGSVVGGDLLRLECLGPNYTIKKNGAVLVTGSIGNPAFTSTRQGFVARSVAVNPFCDSYSAGLL